MHLSSSFVAVQHEDSCRFVSILTHVFRLNFRVMNTRYFILRNFFFYKQTRQNAILWGARRSSVVIFCVTFAYSYSLSLSLSHTCLCQPEHAPSNLGSSKPEVKKKNPKRLGQLQYIGTARKKQERWKSRVQGGSLFKKNQVRYISYLYYCVLLD